MTCDEAFDALTDPMRHDPARHDPAGHDHTGHDHTGHDAESLRQHLAACPRCRQMEDVLRPALAPLSNAARSDTLRHDSARQDSPRWHSEQSDSAQSDSARSDGNAAESAREESPSTAIPLSWESVAQLRELADESRAAARRLQAAGEGAMSVPAGQLAAVPGKRWTRLRWAAAGFLAGFVGTVGLSFVVAAAQNAAARAASTTSASESSICVWKQHGANAGRHDSDGTIAATTSSAANGAAATRNEANAAQPNASQPNARQIALTCVACHLPTGP